jgi:hypothetical protein
MKGGSTAEVVLTVVPTVEPDLVEVPQSNVEP